MPPWSRSQLQALAVVVLLIGGALFLFAMRAGHESASGTVFPTPAGTATNALGTVDVGTPPPGGAAPQATPKPAPPGEIVVDVAGAVYTPGVYRLAPGSRVNDAVRAAGGPRSDAALGDINLAAKLEDGQQVLVPAAHAPAPAVPETATPSPSPPPAPPAPLPTAVPPAATGPIDLNTATDAQLQQLPGIGEEMARRILAYRQVHGPIRQLEQLRDVPGIGAKRIERIRPFVRPQ